MTIFYLLSTGRIALSLSVVLVLELSLEIVLICLLYRWKHGGSELQNHSSHIRTGEMCGQQLNPELDGSEEANAEERDHPLQPHVLSAWLDPGGGWAVPVHTPYLSGRIPLHLHLQ